MRDPVKTPPRDPVRDPMRDRKSNGGMSRWIWIGVLVLLGLIFIFWFSGMMDDTADIDAAPSATLPAEEAIDEPEAEVIEIQPETDAAPGSEADTDTIPSTPPE